MSRGSSSRYNIPIAQPIEDIQEQQPRNEHLVAEAQPLTPFYKQMLFWVILILVIGASAAISIVSYIFLDGRNNEPNVGQSVGSGDATTDLPSSRPNIVPSTAPSLSPSLRLSPSPSYTPSSGPSHPTAEPSPSSSYGASYGASYEASYEASYV